ncbi:hypothetical protein HDU76_001006 [Blyttiomyces sp. JEL0837]|nr:hypothetical protein HDU76_001006 [Blyttiomyces sp. JEL0837]
MAGANSFFMGVRKTFPNATMNVRVLNIYYDEYKEKQATERFVKEGMTVVTHHTDSLQPMKIMTEAGLYGVGTYYDSQGILGNHVLTAAMLFWEPVYTKIIQMALDGTLGGKTFVLQFQDAATGISRMSAKIPTIARRLIQCESQRLMQSSRDNEPLFCGPLRDSTGKLKVAAGTCLSRLDLSTMDWWVDGITDLGDFVAIPPPEGMNYIGAPLRWVVYVLTICAIVILLAIFFFTLINSDHVVIKASSARFCEVMVLSFCFALAGNFLFGLDDESSSDATLDAACKALPWVVSLPTTVGIAALFAKVWRVKQIFTTKSSQSLGLKDPVLFGILAIILAPDLFIVAIWTAVKPLHWSRTTLQKDTYGFSISSYGICMEGDGSYSSYFVLIVAVYKAIILAYGSVLAQQTRNVPTALNESEVINFCLVVAFEVLAIIFPLNYVITTSPPALFVFRAGSNLLINFGIPMIIMSPKISHVIWPNEETQRVIDFISSGSKKRRGTLGTSNGTGTSTSKLGGVGGSHGILSGGATHEYSSLSTSQLGNQSQSQLLGTSENEIKAYAALPINANVGGKK